MVDEIGIFRRNDGALQVIADLFVGNPLVFQARLGVGCLQLGKGSLHERTAARISDTEPQYHYEQAKLIKKHGGKPREQGYTSYLGEVKSASGHASGLKKLA